MSNSSAMNISNYAIKFTGNPSTDAAKAKSLKQDGPLMIANDHVWAKMLPDALEKGAGENTKVISMTDAFGTVIPGALYSQLANDYGLHAAVRNSRLAAFVQKCDEQGLDSSPIVGPMHIAYPPMKQRGVGATKTTKPTLQCGS